MRHPVSRLHFAVLVAVVLPVRPATAQGPPPRADGRVSFVVNTANRSVEGLDSRRDTELATMLTFRTPDREAPSLDATVDLRHAHYTTVTRPDRVSLYDGYVGARFGTEGQFRVRAGHMWLPDLGTAGALAGGLFEYRQAATTHAGFRLAAGAFSGAEPLVYDTGYAPGIRKHGGYFILQRGFMQRHVVGYARVQQQGVTERELLTITNYVPARSGFFLYQAAEVDLKGPANGAAAGGLSYFLANVRASAGSRVELNGTYNRGRSLDARRLTDDVLNGRTLTPEAVEGLHYESAGGRIILRVARQTDVWGGYYRDRTNRDDVATGRTTVGGHAGNLMGTGIDLSGTVGHYERPNGGYTSTYLSIGHPIGRSWYVSGDYSTSLSVVRFVRSDGVVIETRPSTRRYSGNVNATIDRHFSLMVVVDYTTDEGFDELRIVSGLTYRLR